MGITIHIDCLLKICQVVDGIGVWASTTGITNTVSVQQEVSLWRKMNTNRAGLIIKYVVIPRWQTQIPLRLAASCIQSTSFSSIICLRSRATARIYAWTDITLLCFFFDIVDVVLFLLLKNSKRETPIIICNLPASNFVFYRRCSECMCVVIIVRRPLMTVNRDKYILMWGNSTMPQLRAHIIYWIDVVVDVDIEARTWRANAPRAHPPAHSNATNLRLIPFIPPVIRAASETMHIYRWVLNANFFMFFFYSASIK